MMLHFARCRRAGFTLIEIMIVIAIIAILAGIVVPNIFMARFEAGLTACQENCRAGLQAVQMARVRHTLKEVVNMLESHFGPDGYSYVMGGGKLEGSFVEAGYLEKALKCEVAGGCYYFGFCYPTPSAKSNLCRDWQYAQPCNDGGIYCTVSCYKGHNPPPGVSVDNASGKITPCYDESFGACFFKD